jgi:hypothetical protein
MPLRVRLIGSTRSEELLSFLRGIGADARREGEAIMVTRRHVPVRGEPRQQDRIELEFVIRAWASDRPEIEFEIDEAA